MKRLGEFKLEIYSEKYLAKSSINGFFFFFFFFPCTIQIKLFAFVLLIVFKIVVY